MDEQTFYSFTLNYLQNKELARQILPLAEKYLSDPTKLTYEWNYKNTYTENEGLAQESELKFFKDFILEQSKKYFRNRSIKLKEGMEFWVSIFASEMSSGDQHHPHTHPGALLSGLIYLQVPDGSSNLEFSSPRHHNSAWLNFLEEESYSQKNDFFEVKSDHTIVIKPVEGLFLFWESWALHRVPVNESTEPRRTMVFNVGADYGRL